MFIIILYIIINMTWAWKYYTATGASGFTQTISTTTTSTSGVTTDKAVVGTITGVISYDTSHFNTEGANKVNLPVGILPGNYTIAACVNSTGTNPNSWCTITLNIAQGSNGATYVNALFTAVSGGGWGYSSGGPTVTNWQLTVPQNATFQVNVSIIPLCITEWGNYSTP